MQIYAPGILDAAKSLLADLDAEVLPGDEHWMNRVNRDKLLEDICKIIARHTRVAELRAALARIANLAVGSIDPVGRKLDKINSIARRALDGE